MIERIFLHLAFFAINVVAICYGSKLNSNEAQAKIFLNQTSDKLFSFHDEMSNLYFDNHNNSYDQFQANRNSTIFLTKIVEYSRKFDFKNFKDGELKYAFEVLVKVADEQIIGEERYIELFNSLVELENLFVENIDEYHNSSNKLTFTPDVGKIFEISNDPEELQYYWSAWRNITGQWTEQYLSITIEALKDAAHLTELSPLEFWMRGLNITDMENLINEFQPLYLELHALIRSLLQEKYGESHFNSDDGLIPDHLFQQVIYQAWSNENDNSIIEKMFPYESLPPLENVTMEKFNPKQSHEIAENFLEELGFEKYPSSIWGDRIRSKFEEDDADCGSEFRILTPNIHLEYCEKLHFCDFLDAYSSMTYIYSAKEMVGLPAYFFNLPNSLLDAIGSAVILSASTHHNLEAVGMISDFNITQDVEMSRLLKMAIRNLLYIPINFVHAKVMSDLLEGNVKMADINNHYWHLMDKYAGVGPPKGHKSQTYDLPETFLREMNDNQMSIDFTSEVLSYQIHKKLCELSEKYPAQPLHLCYINGSKSAGNALKKMMQLGTSKPFYEVLATMFPENPTVRVEALLEYYDPIKNLLVKKNKEANVKPGWKTSDSNKS